MTILNGTTLVVNNLRFVDTIFAFHYSCAEQWIRLLAHNRSGRLSFQVLQELYVSRSEAQEIIKVLTAWQPVAVDLAMLNRAWVLQGSPNRMTER